MLVSSRFLFVGPFPALQIPNFKTSAVAYESDLIFQTNLLAKLVRQHQTTLSVGGCMLSARMQLSQENAAITRGDVVIRFRSFAHFRKLNRRHDQKKLVSCLGQKNEFFRTIAPPARRDRDPILLVDGMPELSGIKAFGLGVGIHVSRGVVVHFTPFDPTFNHLPTGWSIKILTLICTWSPRP
jgi:hypothetical protein